MSITSTQIKKTYEQKTYEQKTESVYDIIKRLNDCGIGQGGIGSYAAFYKLIEGLKVIDFIKTFDEYKKNSQNANNNYINNYNMASEHMFLNYGIRLRELNNLTTDSFYKISFMEVSYLFMSYMIKIPDDLRLLFSKYFTFTMTSVYNKIFEKHDIYYNNYVTCIRTNWKTKKLPVIKKNIVDKLILQDNKHIKSVDGNNFKLCRYLDIRGSKVRCVKNFNNLKLLIISSSDIKYMSLDNMLLCRYNKGHLKILTISSDDSKLECVKSSDIPTENYLIEQWIKKLFTVSI